MATGQQKSSMFSGSPEYLRKEQADKANVARQRQALALQRENILSQRTSNPARRAALEAALAHIEAQLQALD